MTLGSGLVPGAGLGERRTAVPVSIWCAGPPTMVNSDALLESTEKSVVGSIFSTPAFSGSEDKIAVISRK